MTHKCAPSPATEQTQRVLLQSRLSTDSHDFDNEACYRTTIAMHTDAHRPCLCSMRHLLTILEQPYFLSFAATATEHCCRLINATERACNSPLAPVASICLRVRKRLRVLRVKKRTFVARAQYRSLFSCCTWARWFRLCRRRPHEKVVCDDHFCI